MPRDGSNIYHRPAGTDGVPNFPIESSKYNAYVADVEQDLNLPRPIVAGGSGANSAASALINLSGEQAAQIVTNWDSMIWMPGSFYAATTATGTAPVAAHAFSGICYSSDPLPVGPSYTPVQQNIVLEARDLTDTANLKYVRVMKAGVWGAWTNERSTIYAAPFDALAYNGMQVNGSMEVSQELGTAGTGTNGLYICDGWRLLKNGTMVINAAVSLAGWVPGITGLMICSVSTAQASLGSGDYVYVFQSIEGYRIARLAWGTASAQSVTLGFWTAHHRTGIYSGSICTGGGTGRTYAFTYTQNNADISEYKTITIPGCTDGVWPVDNTGSLQISFAIAAGSAQLASAANVWLSGVANRAAPGQVNGVNATNDAFRITGAALFPGIEAPSAARSPLIMRPYDQELITCKRYFQKMSCVVDTISAGQSIFLSPEMRAVPVITGGGAGFTVNSPSAVSPFVYQTTRAVQTLTMDARF